jgi:choline transport protein
LFGFAVCELITWETVLARKSLSVEHLQTSSLFVAHFCSVLTWSVFSQAFENGGPAGCVYGFIIAWSSTLSVYVVISELASLAPVACGQYFWVYLLSPPKWKVFSSYTVGWLTSLAWVATVATECLFAGTILQGLLILDYDDYDAKLWQGTLLSWLVVTVCVFVNSVVPGMLPKFEIFIIVFHLAGFVAIVAVMWKFAPHGNAKFVFLTAYNNGGWSSQGLSYCVGFLGNVRSTSSILSLRNYADRLFH